MLLQKQIKKCGMNSSTSREGVISETYVWKSTWRSDRWKIPLGWPPCVCVSASVWASWASPGLVPRTSPAASSADTPALSAPFASSLPLYASGPPLPFALLK